MGCSEQPHRLASEAFRFFAHHSALHPRGRRSLSLDVRRYGSPQRSVRRHVSLWRDSNLRSTAIAHFNELQLFDLPPLRCALGVLRCEFGQN